MGRISAGYLNKIPLQLRSLSQNRHMRTKRKECFWKPLVVLLPRCWGSPAGSPSQAPLLPGAADRACSRQSDLLLKLRTLKSYLTLQDIYTEFVCSPGLWQSRGSPKAGLQDLWSGSAAVAEGRSARAALQHQRSTQGSSASSSSFPASSVRALRACVRVSCVGALEGSFLPWICSVTF